MSIFDLAHQAQSPSMGGAGGIGALASDSIYPLSRMDKTQYSTPFQLPTSAEVISTDYDPKVDAFTGMPNQRFAQGGIASIPRFDGETGSQVEEVAPSWNPESGQVKLQTPDPQDPYGEMKTVDYAIPKDQIKNYAPNIDQTTGLPTGGGAYVLNDGSTMHVGRDGIVQVATPGRNDYKLNEQGYYQPVGENLTWNGGLNQLTKKVGGVDVVVDPMFTKGGYQDEKGNLRVDENGVPIPLAPNYLDSGAGKSGLADAAPYIVAGTIGAGAGLAALGGGLTYTGVPASQTLLGSLGAAGATAPTIAGGEGTAAINFGAKGAASGFNPALASGAQMGSTLGTTTGSTVGSLGAGTLGTGVPAGLTVAQGSALTGTGSAAAKTAGMPTYQKLLAGSLALKALDGGGSGGGGSSAPTSTTTTTSAPQMQYPQQQQLVMAPFMNTNTSGAAYNPMIYSYNTRRAAQGGLMYQQGGVADLGGYAAGGKLLKGPGDGMSDDIVANIAGKQPARLADGEFVVPADVVSHLGNGSTDAGAKHLYKMMDRIRQARTGNSKQGKRINPNKFLPKG